MPAASGVIPQIATDFKNK